MPFNPHTPADIKAMLEAIGVGRIDDLFDEIPAALRGGPLQGVAGGMSEMAVGRLMRGRAAEDGEPLCFIGAGAYDHHIPAAVWAIATRGELYSAYTPYQAEASQGTLQIIYEFQSMIAGLTGLDVANASLYDGASALAEAILMAVRANRKAKAPRILLPSTIHPAYRAAADTIVRNQGIELVDVPYNPKLGRVDPEEFDALLGEGLAAVVIPQPNFFGCLEEVDALTDRAHAHGALVIGLVNPVALALLKPPGQWGGAGADIACGEGQPLGVPLSSGGPYFGFMSCRQQHVRQMPGRIVGRTVDAEGRPGFTLTLQAREQHIRRSKATSNICTNQGLLAAAATVHMALLGPEGLERVALASHANTRALVDKLAAIDGVERVFDAPVFHETVLRLDEPVEEILRALAAQDILGGYPLAGEYPELENTLLVCATEMRGAEDIEAYAGQLERILSRRRTGPGCTRLRPPEGTI